MWEELRAERGQGQIVGAWGEGSVGTLAFIIGCGKATGRF